MNVERKWNLEQCTAFVLKLGSKSPRALTVAPWPGHPAVPNGRDLTNRLSFGGIPVRRWLALTPASKGQPVLRAVVVDDEPDLRLLARYMIEDDGVAEVIGEACTASDAITLIHDLEPDVAIIDIHLPDGSGVDLIQKLRGEVSAIRLVAYSSDDLALEAAIQAGADDAVLKSGRYEELLAAVMR
jgi:CheY-like chemotaxis protein